MFCLTCFHNGVYQRGSEMAEDKRFKMKISVNITENGAGEFMDNDLVYSNLKYEDVTMLEGLLTGVLMQLNEVAKGKGK